MDRIELELNRFMALISCTHLLSHVWRASGVAESIVQARKIMLEDRNQVVDHWIHNPWLTFAQVLIELGYIKDNGEPWTEMSNEDILKAQNVPLRNYLMWGQKYNKNGKPLDEIKWHFIRDMETSHIKAVLNSSICKNKDKLNAFNSELIERGRF